MDAVFFDIDDTLYNQGQPFAYAVHKVYGPLPGVTDEELFRASRKHSTEVFAAFNEGRRPTEDIYARRMIGTFAEFGISIDRDLALEIQHAYASSSDVAMSLSGAMAQTLDLCSRFCRLGVITNGTEARQRGKLLLLSINRWIPWENVFISDALGMAKPDPAIFTYACAQMRVLPQNCLFVGDTYDNDVVGAKAADMPVIWFNRRHNAKPADGPDADWTVTTDGELLALMKTILR